MTTISTDWRLTQNLMAVSRKLSSGRSANGCRFIRAATDERDFYAMKSLHFEKLKGKRSRQYSMRLNDQWRLILEMEGKGNDKVLVIVAIEDYH